MTKNEFNLAILAALGTIEDSGYRLAKLGEIATVIKLHGWNTAYHRYYEYAGIDKPEPVPDKPTPPRTTYDSLGVPLSLFTGKAYAGQQVKMRL
ncbi:hypothetical protein ACFLTP_07710 [Chloroflexota bacterium]